MDGYTLEGFWYLDKDGQATQDNEAARTILGADGKIISYAAAVECGLLEAPPDPIPVDPLEGLPDGVSHMGGAVYSIDATGERAFGKNDALAKAQRAGAGGGVEPSDEAAGAEGDGTEKERKAGRKGWFKKQPDRESD